MFECLETPVADGNRAQSCSSMKTFDPTKFARGVFSNEIGLVCLGLMMFDDV